MMRSNSKEKTLLKLIIESEAENSSSSEFPFNLVL